MTLTLASPATSAQPRVEMQTLMEHFIQLHVSQLVCRVEVTSMIRRYFGPLQAYALADIRPLIVEAWFREIGARTHPTANKCLTILRTMFEKAREWELFDGENPARRVKKYPKHERDRFITLEEMPRLQAALQHEQDDTQCFFLLCLLVGCRRTEALTMRWVDLDFDRRVWRKPATKTGRTHTVPIPLSLLDRLAALPRINEWVFATKQGHLSRSTVFDRWDVIRQAAEIRDVTIHDLRRSCASWLAIQGANFAVIGKGVLNHTSLAHTGIYARLNVSPVTQALEENSTRMMGCAPPPPPKIEVDPLTSRQRDILRLAVNGHDRREIAAALGITPRTVTVHKFHARERLKRHKVAPETLLGTGCARWTEADPMPAPVTAPAPMSPHPYQTMVSSPSREEERDEWPG